MAMVVAAVMVMDTATAMADTAWSICWCQLVILETAAGQLHPAVMMDGNQAVAGNQVVMAGATAGTKPRPQHFRNSWSDCKEFKQTDFIVPKTVGKIVTAVFAHVFCKHLFIFIS